MVNKALWEGEIRQVGKVMKKKEEGASRVKTKNRGEEETKKERNRGMGNWAGQHLHMCRFFFFFFFFEAFDIYLKHQSGYPAINEGEHPGEDKFHPMPCHSISIPFHPGGGSVNLLQSGPLTPTPLSPGNFFFFKFFQLISSPSSSSSSSYCI